MAKSLPGCELGVYSVIDASGTLHKIEHESLKHDGRVFAWFKHDGSTWLAVFYPQKAYHGATARRLKGKGNRR